MVSAPSAAPTGCDHKIEVPATLTTQRWNFPHALSSAVFGRATVGAFEADIACSATQEPDLLDANQSPTRWDRVSYDAQPQVND